MQDSNVGEEDAEVDEDSEAKIDMTTQARKGEEHHKEEEDVNEDAWEIKVTAELKRKMVGPWQTSVILRLMGKQLGYCILQTRHGKLMSIHAQPKLQLRLSGFDWNNCPLNTIIWSF
ncbi:hypothetical protein SO802_012764 [Lithocarpus litseifolius]|uniref:Uncharacterized protein n=1 Tax=Lithocarpus litseifolius TaxID=425828 RepID=A0AAW2D675_9ROSI